MRDLDYYIVIGYKVINKLLSLNELHHHGIKGQKWGVKNGPPYPLSKDKHDSIVGGNVVNDSILSGKVSIKINKDMQRNHNLIGHKEGRSYLYGDSEFAQNLIDKLHGTGIPVMSKKDEWNKKEKVENDTIVGIYVDPVTGEEMETKSLMINYSKTRTHIYPRNGGKKK